MGGLFVIGIIVSILLLFQPAVKPAVESAVKPAVKSAVKSDKLFASDPIIKPYVEKLKAKVKKDLNGTIPEEYIDKIFSSPELTYLPNLMIKRLTWKEVELPYDQFLEESRIKRAREFMKKHWALLTAIENHFNVDKEVITAIFLVETNLGQNTGKFPVFNVFFSLALSGEKNLFKNFVKDKGISLEDERVQRFIKKRSDWAYNELLYLIEIAYKNHWDPFSIKGSIFGAFGFPQFVPRSYLIYGYDWDKDGKVDLYSIPDALASIANYLRMEGYDKNADFRAKKRVIMKYNISEPYANTVLAIAERLKNLAKN
jgi:membrane-bound lytic murein transglycosylase B